MDNGTMVESFKFLNYCQLAKNSLASKRFRDLIRMHRHKLALLNVDSIDMVGILFVSPKLEQGINASYATVFDACADINHENWPLFEHFIRLLTDPFIYVEKMRFFARNDILHLLETAMNPDRNRLQCNYLCCDLEGNAPKFISWIKNHVRCDRLIVSGYKDSNEPTYEGELLDLFMTGANCSSSVYLMYNSFPKIVYNFVQKFLDLKECDEFQAVKTVEFSVHNGSIDELKEKYARFIVKEEPSSRDTKYTFEFVNDNIGKKLELTCMPKYIGFGYDLSWYLSCCVSNL
ncbi:hypothetical protein Ddc_11257 [Ditylenchus destructor]|nr:hypothetical protein Ddc_11257 [Ditylenchus destructor]